MISRFGSNELSSVVNYQAVHDRRSRIVKSFLYVSGKMDAWWWDEGLAANLCNQAGVFPNTIEIRSRFAQRVLEDCRSIDLLGSWIPEESFLDSLMPGRITVPLYDLEPYFNERPWTIALEGKNVLVIHPFEESIRRQYARRQTLFKDSHVLPAFDLMTLKAVQSAGSNETGFATWFDALEWMCDEVGKLDFDCAIIGAGAYGLPLAAFIKRMGKKAIHLGGASQILLGIRGKRWDGMEFYRNLCNENWVRPNPQEMPHNPNLIEDACYW